MRWLLLRLFTLVFAAGCDKAPGIAESVKSNATKPSPTENNPDAKPAAPAKPTLIGTWESAKPNRDGVISKIDIQKNGELVGEAAIPGKPGIKYTVAYTKINDKKIEVPEQQVVIADEDYEIGFAEYQWVDANTMDRREDNEITRFVRNPPVSASGVAATPSKEANPAKAAAPQKAAVTIDPARVPFLGTWWVKKAAEGFKSHSLELKADGTFNYISFAADGQRIQVPGKWNISAEKTLAIANGSSKGTGLDQATGEMLDDTTLEFDKSGTKSLYTRMARRPTAPVPPLVVTEATGQDSTPDFAGMTPSKAAPVQGVPATGPFIGYWKAKTLDRGMKKQAFEIKPDGTYTIYVLSDIEDGYEHGGVWKKISDRKIVMLYKESINSEEYEVSGELIDAETFVVDAPTQGKKQLIRGSASDPVKDYVATAAEKEKFVGAWKAKKSLPAITSEVQSLNADGTAVYDVAYERGVVYKLKGTWKVVAENKIVITRQQPDQPEVHFKCIAKFLDGEVLDIEIARMGLNTEFERK
jgi:hypothetical protein